MGGGISERFQWNLSIPLLSYFGDEVLENVVSKMKYASLVIARVKAAAKKEVKKPLEQFWLYFYMHIIHKHTCTYTYPNSYFIQQ